MAQESWNREKEETGCRVPEGLILCANNCGLFGSPATLNLCSKCYRDLQLQKASPEDSNSKGAFAASARSSSSQVGVYVEEEKAGPSLAVATEKAPLNEAAVIKQTTNRCSSCRKRVGLTGFRCRCGHMFCGIHRYSDKHGCTFDYKAFAREAIAKANPVVKADKVIRF